MALPIRLTGARLFKTFPSPRRRLAPIQSMRALPRRGCSRIRAAEGGSGSEGSPRFSWNPFKEDTSKQEAAEKALREAMGGKKDVLAQFDEGGGGDGGDDGGEGWSWNWSWDDWKGGFRSFAQAVLQWLTGVGQTFKAILIIALGILCAAMIGPILSTVGTFGRVLFRLEKAEDVYGSQVSEPAGMQRSVLFSDDEDEALPKPSAVDSRRLENQELQKSDSVPSEKD